MATKLNSTKSHLTFITQKKLRDLTLFSPEKLGPRNALINERLTTDFKTQLKRPKSIKCQPIRSVEYLRPINLDNNKQLKSVSNCNIVKRPLKLTKDQVTRRELNNRQPCQPTIKAPPSQPSLLPNKTTEKKSSKTKLEKTPSPAEHSLIQETVKVVPGAEKSPRANKFAMENSKLLKRPSTSNGSPPATNNTNLISSRSKQVTNKLNRPKTSSSSSSSSSLAGWKSPFKTFITTGVRTRKSLHGCPESHEFSYDLSRDELKCWGKFEGPMKPAPQQERQLLTNGQRIEYLTQRYEHSPHNKYNYPEATSWRIGWLQQQQQQQQQQQKQQQQQQTTCL